MGIIQDWSVQYGIEESFMAEIHMGDTLHLLYPRPDVTSRILGRNSELLQEWLSGMPEPSRNARHFGINIVFLLPTDKAFYEVFQGDFHPKFAFEEREDQIATYFFDKSGSYYLGPNVSGNPPTYLEMTGAGCEGFRKVANEAMSAMIEKGFFVYSMALGHVYDQRKDARLTGHREVGVGGYVLWYGVTGRFYDPTSVVQPENLKRFWAPNERRTLEAKIKAINRKFFRKAKTATD